MSANTPQEAIKQARVAMDKAMEAMLRKRGMLLPPVSAEEASMTE